MPFAMAQFQKAMVGSMLLGELVICTHCCGKVSDKMMGSDVITARIATYPAGAVRTTQLRYSVDR